MIDIESLKEWFCKDKRDLPWRNNPAPYAVWVSEVMLQQTQVAVVVPYFLRWMERFPTIEALASAPLDDVIKMWEGLGYYSRARSLHEGAKYILTHFDGLLPSNKEELGQIKGLGPYTIGAILSFAFHRKVAAVDGNVIRVLARYFKIEEDISKSATIKRLRQLAESVLPDEESWVVNEALIELGATVCQRKPKCSSCPISGSCAGYKSGVESQIPINTKKVKVERLMRAVAVIHYRDWYLIRKGKKGEVMSDLHEFPFFELKGKTPTLVAFKKMVEETFHIGIGSGRLLDEERHSFTRYQVTLKPGLFEVKCLVDVPGFEWRSVEEMRQLAFSSGHRRIFETLQKQKL